MEKTRSGKYKQPEYTSYNIRNDDIMTTDCQKTYLAHKKVTKIKKKSLQKHFTER